MQHTFILIKPDAVQRRLAGRIISRFEQKGFTLSAMQMLKPSDKCIEDHYAEHIKKPWFGEFKAYMQSGNLIAMIWSGMNVVKESRKIIGATNPTEATVGSIRGDYAIETGRNLVHGSDSEEAAKREIAIWFGDNFNWEENCDAKWVYEK